ncbi:MAG: hypothetical protein AB1779_08615 [Candidatus Thermoplasmatota archaeon]
MYFRFIYFLLFFIIGNCEAANFSSIEIKPEKPTHESFLNISASILENSTLVSEKNISQPMIVYSYDKIEKGIKPNGKNPYYVELYPFPSNTVINFYLTAIVDNTRIVSEEESISISALLQILWHHNFSEGYELSKVLKKKIMLSFYSEWIKESRDMDNKTYSHQKVIEKSEKFVCIRLEESEIYDIRVYPTVVFMNFTGEEIYRSIGYKDGKKFADIMSYVLGEKKNIQEKKGIPGFDCSILALAISLFIFVNGPRRIYA